MKNVTISMDDETLRWVRLRAAEAGMSVSRWIADQIGARQAEAARKAAASRLIEQLVAEFPGLPLSENGKISIDRDEIHDDGRFRRFDDPALSAGHARTDEEDALRGVAEDPEGPGSLDP
jgi:hypothetical protein